MKVLVTGGAGYIGSHTAMALAGAGHDPVVFDNLSTGHQWAVKWGTLIEADLADISAIRKALNEHAIDAVIHFAASAYVGESMKEPGKYFQNNVVNSLNLLQAMKDVGVKKIVFSSSCATYGMPESLPINEEHPTNPVNPYGESKLMVEKMLRWYGDIHDFKWIALRYFNAAGADPDGELGEDHDPETHLIPLVLDAALGKRDYIEIFGNDYATHDGTCIRDYIHVSDLASAHILALKYLLHGGRSEIFNLGNGNGFSVNEVIDTVKKITSKDINIINSNRRKGDPARLIGDSAKARKILKWKPLHNKLESIIASALKWDIISG